LWFLPGLFAHWLLLTLTHLPPPSSPPPRVSRATDADLLLLSGVEAELALLGAVAALVPRAVRADLEHESRRAAPAPAATIFSMMLAGAGAEPADRQSPPLSPAFSRVSSKGFEMLLEAAALACGVVLRCCAAAETSRRRLLAGGTSTLAVLTDVLRCCHCHVDLAVQTGVLPSSVLDVSVVEPLARAGSGSGSGAEAGGCVLTGPLRELHDALGFVAVPAVQALRLFAGDACAK